MEELELNVHFYGPLKVKICSLEMFPVQGIGKEGILTLLECTHTGINIQEPDCVHSKSTTTAFVTTPTTPLSILTPPFQPRPKPKRLKTGIVQLIIKTTLLPSYPIKQLLLQLST